MDDILHDLLTALLLIVGAAGGLAHHIETRMLALLGAKPDQLATTSFRLFPNPEVIEYINHGLSAHSQIDTPQDINQRLRAPEQLLGLILLALMVPYFARRRDRTDPQGIVSVVLAPLVVTHWSVAYFVALLRTWTLGGTLYTALYQLAAGRAGAFAGLLWLVGMSCT